MRSLVQDGLTRAATFFALAFGLTAFGGIAIGDVRYGVKYGFALGVVFAVFAYLFVRPAPIDDTNGGSGDQVDDDTAPVDSAADTDE